MQIAQVLAGYTLGGADLLRRAMGKKIQAEMDAQRQQFVEGAPARGVERAPRRADLRPDGEIRRLRLQQIACRRLCAGRLPDRLSEGQLPGRVHGRVDDARSRQHRQAQPFPPGAGPARHRAPAARHQPLRRRPSRSRPTRRPASRRSAMRWPRSRGSASRRCASWSPSARRAARSRICSISRCGSTPKASTAASSRTSSRPAPSKASTRTGRRASPRPNCCCARRAAPPRSARTGRRACSPAIAAGRRLCRAPALPVVPDWPPVERLQNEFEAIGFYLSSHPLDPYGKSLERAGILRWTDLPAALAAGGATRFRLAGIVIGKKERTSARGSRFAFVQLSDTSRRLRGDGVFRGAGSGPRAARQRPAADRHRRCPPRGGEPAADRAEDRAAGQRRRPCRRGAARLCRRGRGPAAPEEPDRARGRRPRPGDGRARPAAAARSRSRSPAASASTPGSAPRSNRCPASSTCTIFERP